MSVENSTIKIMIADDHTLMREGIKQILSADARLSVIAEASDGHVLIQQLRHMNAQVNIILLDWSMPGKSGVELIRQLKQEWPAVFIVVLSMHAELPYVSRAIKAGASGYILKESTAAQLLSALHKVAEGGVFMSPSLAEQLAFSRLAPEETSLLHESLSDREFQVFCLLAQGHTVSAIAEQLNLSVKTISTHKTHLMQKMQLSNHSELVRYALLHQLI